MADLRAESVDRFLGALAPALFVAKLRQPKKIQGSDRTCSWFRAVVVFLQAQKNARVISGAAEVASLFFIKEQSVLCLLQFDREAEPIHLERSFIKVEQCLNDKGVVVRESFYLAPALAIISDQNLFLFIVELRANEHRRPRRGFEISGIAQHLRAAGISGDHQAVPGRNDL